MYTARSLLRRRATAALFVLAIGGQILATGAAQAHGRRHPTIDRDYYSYQGHAAKRPGAFRGDFRHDDEPTLSQRIGTN